MSGLFVSTCNKFWGSRGGHKGAQGGHEGARRVHEGPGVVAIFGSGSYTTYVAYIYIYVLIPSSSGYRGAKSQDLTSVNPGPELDPITAIPPFRHISGKGRARGMQEPHEAHEACRASSLHCCCFRSSSACFSCMPG